MSGQFWLLLLIIVLVAVAWLFAAAEASFARLSRARLEEEVAAGNSRAEKLLAVADDPVRYVNSLLLAGTFTALTAFAAVVGLLAELLSWSFGWVLVLATVIMGLLSYVLFGVSARTVGRQHPTRIALATLGVTQLVTAVLGPLTKLLILVGNAITPGRGYRAGPFSTQAELRELVDAAQKAALIEDQESRMIHSVFDLGGTTVRQVMVPRTEMVFIERGKTLRQAQSLALRSGFSRIPVIGEGTDDVVGVMFLKDVVQRLFEHRDADRSERVESLMRGVSFVPDSKPVDDLLREMQAHREHLAIVIDEFGGTAGLVTIEDILEEIVGEIADEYDQEVPEIVSLPQGQLRVSPRVSLEHFGEAADIDLDADVEGVDTVGGLIALRLGRVPIPGAEIVEQGWRLRAESAEGRRNRIGTIVASPPETSEIEDDEAEARGGNQ